jgi:uncharacterized protein (TIGR03437 family)
VLWSTFLGGIDRDASAAIALDAKGNVYIAGNTASPDFPTTTPHVGPIGTQNVFAVKLDPSGKLVYSAVFGGESTDTATGLAVNTSGEAHVVGWTTSKSFPATRGAFQIKAGDNDGFAVKLEADGTIAYASYLPEFSTYNFDELSLNPPRVVAVAAEARGSALVGGYAGMLSRMSSDGSSLTTLPAQPGQIFTMESDGQGNIYVAGMASGASTGSGQCFEGFYSHTTSTLPAGDIFLTKLHTDDLQQIFSARLFGACQSWPGTVRIGPTGQVAVGLWTFSDFPMHDPVLPFPNCYLYGAAAVSHLSADGSALLFSSYLDMCAQAPAIALAADGSIYAGVTRGTTHFETSGSAGVLRIPMAQPGGPSVAGAFNAFSGAAGYATPGMLLTITGQNLAPRFIDLSLGVRNPLPKELGGVQVMFDGTPVEMFQVAPDHVICVVPTAVDGKDSVTVQVVNGSEKSVPFVLPVAYSNSGFLTRLFPHLPLPKSVDGNIRNADGTLNDAQHPAASGSTVTLFATGLRGPGDISLLWNAPPPDPNEFLYFLSGTARHMPGFMDALYAVDFRIPDAPGEGVYLVPVPGVLTRAEIGRVGSGLGVYVK